MTYRLSAATFSALYARARESDCGFSREKNRLSEESEALAAGRGEGFDYIR
jgi:hypothetical protein